VKNKCSAPVPLRTQGQCDPCARARSVCVAVR
jgi:hypothetical protein